LYISNVLKHLTTDAQNIPKNMDHPKAKYSG